MSLCRGYHVNNGSVATTLKVGTRHNTEGCPIEVDTSVVNHDRVSRWTDEERSKPVRPLVSQDLQDLHERSKSSTRVAFSPSRQLMKRRAGSVVPFPNADEVSWDWVQTCPRDMRMSSAWSHDVKFESLKVLKQPWFLPSPPVGTLSVSRGGRRDKNGWNGHLKHVKTSSGYSRESGERYCRPSSHDLTGETIQVEDGLLQLLLENVESADDIKNMGKIWRQ